MLIAAYLFSIGGPMVLYQYFSYKSDRFFTEQTRKGMYNKGDLTEVKLPVDMPAITDWKDYVNIKGCIHFNDVSYNYVKMRLTRTAMYLMCVPNYSTTQLTKNNIVDARGAKSVPVPQKQHIPFGKTVLAANYSASFARFSFTTFENTLPDKGEFAVKQALPAYRDIPRQPPKSFCWSSPAFLNTCSRYMYSARFSLFWCAFKIRLRWSNLPGHAYTRMRQYIF